MVYVCVGPELGALKGMLLLFICLNCVVLVNSPSQIYPPPQLLLRLDPFFPKFSERAMVPRKLT